MFRLVRLVGGLALIGALVYVGVSVPLGERTLWEHVKAIAGSQESKELVDGVKDKADELIERSPLDPRNRGEGGEGGDGGDQLTADERRKLRELIRHELGHDGGKKRSDG